MNFMMISTLFLFIPVLGSFYMQEWVYFIIALGVSIFSFLYHSLKEKKLESKKNFKPIKFFDWFFGLIAYAYMYYYIFTEVSIEFKNILLIALSCTGLLFWHGFKFGNYKKTHPWFHILASIVSGLIVIAK